MPIVMYMRLERYRLDEKLRMIKIFLRIEVCCRNAHAFVPLNTSHCPCTPTSVCTFVSRDIVEKTSRMDRPAETGG